MIGDWDNLRAFLALAEEGTLIGAARRLKVSHPTVARRIRVLEEALGTRLFDRLPDRFQPTAPALDLLEDAKEMERAALAIDRRSAGLAGEHLGTVRISVDETMADFLGRHLGALRRDCIEIEIGVNHISANLSRREADLLVRPRVPDLASLIGRKLARFAHAVYGRRTLVAGWDGRPEGLRELPWVGFDEAHQYMPGQEWQARFLGNRRPHVRANNGMVVADAIRRGHAIGVLACFVGDAEPDLVRLTPILEPAWTEQWLLVHADLRMVPRVRIIMDALVALFRDRRAEIEGQAAAAAPAPAPAPA
ncbi:MAG: LysR family transcriptional regulator [Thalassobaculales bacterium]